MNSEVGQPPRGPDWPRVVQSPSSHRLSAVLLLTGSRHDFSTRDKTRDETLETGVGEFLPPRVLFLFIRTTWRKTVSLIEGVLNMFAEVNTFIMRYLHG